MKKKSISEFFTIDTNDIVILIPLHKQNEMIKNPDINLVDLFYLSIATLLY